MPKTEYRAIVDWRTTGGKREVLSIEIKRWWFPYWRVWKDDLDNPTLLAEMERVTGKPSVKLHLKRDHSWVRPWKLIYNGEQERKKNGFWGVISYAIYVIDKTIEARAWRQAKKEESDREQRSKQNESK